MGKVKDKLIEDSEKFAWKFDIPFQLANALGMETNDDQEWEDMCEDASIILESMYSDLVYTVLNRRKNNEN